MSTQRYRPEIDGLRAMAVLAVVIFHAFPTALSGGFVGVDVFFVISGYLISGIIFNGLAEGNFRFRDFYIRRIRRIFPALILVLIASFIAGWGLLLPEEMQQLGKHIIAAAGFVENIVLWQEAGYFDVASNEKPLLHVWSLAVEEQYYVFYPLIIWAAWRLRVNRMLVLIGLLGISFGLNVARIDQHPVSTFFLLHTRMWELLCGAVLAQIELSCRAKPLFAAWFQHPSRNIQRVIAMGWSALAAVGVALIVFAAVRLQGESHFPGWRAACPVIGATLIIAAGGRAWVSRMLLANRLMVFVGLISYPLYLWHWPIFVYARVTAEQLSVAAYGGLIALAIGLAWLTCRFVEKPLRFGANGGRKAGTLSAIMVILAGGGGALYLSDGLAFRLPEMVRNVSFYSSVREERWNHGLKCMLSLEVGNRVHPDECIEKKRPLIVIWGDSTGEALYRGVVAYQEKHHNFGLGLLAGTYCPPLLHFMPREGYDCMGVNQQVLHKLKQARPDAVILTAQWRYGWQGGKGLRLDINDLQSTVSSLRALGVKHIFIAGPAPFFNKGLPKTIAAYYRKYRALIPEYSDYRLGEHEVEESMVNVANRLNVDYISLRDALCDKRGCLTRLPDEKGNIDVPILDEVHVSPSGARHASDIFMPKILQTISAESGNTARE